MSLIEQVNAGIMSSMKAKEQDRLRALRGIKSAFLLLKTAEGVSEVTDDMCVKALQKMAKQRKDSLDIYVQQGREDLAVIERAELAVIESFLPAQMSAEEIETQVKAIIAETGAAGMKDLGKVMPAAMKAMGAVADGKIISETHSKYIDIEVRLTEMEHHKVDCFKTAVYTSAVKCILLEEPSYLQEVENDLKNQMPHLSIARSKPFFLEVVPPGVDKAASLKLLAEKLNIQQGEIIAVGNAGNDLSMVEYAGLGVWVDNVTPELRHKADVIVASNNNDGVAEVVERFIL